MRGWPTHADTLIALLCPTTGLTGNQRLWALFD
jgi:hypothetical protein